MVLDKLRRELEQRAKTGADEVHPDTSRREPGAQPQIAFGPDNNALVPPSNVAHLSGSIAQARVVIHARDGTIRSEASANELSLRLGSNVGRVETRLVAAVPSVEEIRYFYYEDAATARALAELPPSIQGGWRVRDFSQFRPLPSSSTLAI